MFSRVIVGQSPEPRYEPEVAAKVPVNSRWWRQGEWEPVQGGEEAASQSTAGLKGSWDALVAPAWEFQAHVAEASQTQWWHLALLLCLFLGLPVSLV